MQNCSFVTPNGEIPTSIMFIEPRARVIPSGSLNICRNELPKGPHITPDSDRLTTQAVGRMSCGPYIPWLELSISVFMVPIRGRVHLGIIIFIIVILALLSILTLIVLGIHLTNLLKEFILDESRRTVERGEYFSGPWTVQRSCTVGS